MHRKPLDGWTRASHSSRCPVLLLSAKIRCCHLRNNTLSMWYEVFFDSVGALCTDCVKLAFLFLESWGLLTVCFFFVCLFLCYLSLPLFGRRLAEGLSVNLFSAFSAWRQALDGSVHRVTPSPDSALGKFWRRAPLSVSLDCALICYTLVEIDSPESVL